MLNNKSLRLQVLSGIAWRGGADIVQHVLQIVFTVILARLLSKGDFGLAAMALLVNRFVTTITNIGFGNAIIQSQTITKGQISAIFFVQLSLNIFLTILVFINADLAASFFDEPQLTLLIKTFSFVIILQSLQFPNILLRKELMFKSFSLLEIMSMVISNSIAIILAIRGFGVWALVWRLIVQRLIFGIFSFYYSEWVPTKPEFKGIKPLFRFGINMLGSNFTYYFAENLVALITGKYLGKDVLGLFNIAYNLAIVPATKIQSIITSVLTPGFSKIQNSIGRFRNNYTKALDLTSLLFIPIMVMLMATSTNLIPIIYGAKWQGAGNMLMFLSLVGIIRGLSHILRSAILAKGKSNIIFISTLTELIPSLPLMYLLMPYYGIYGLILGYAFGAILGWIYTSNRYNKIIELRCGVWSTIKVSVTISLILFLMVYGVNAFGLQILTTLVIQLIMGLVIYIMLVWSFKQDILYNIIIKMKKAKS
ncbi:lipopolysaccharide biosynthesis protein [Flavivirga sp. 57AJ16]|uniref:lipopolysaccharide biosynthesis protein n=1 Tax=Flavivirga sp. 57AJ16 TaxID=3025307 RepID=UPI0023662F1E|nr:lipopolysaccharide biosynthesis protein [Flavivirga sp. 57AJ16]MDD7886233.1 lipopolysaccharide biosynthesis protein [Flavivirga sp. 57AJ16]